MRSLGITEEESDGVRRNRKGFITEQERERDSKGRKNTISIAYLVCFWDKGVNRGKTGARQEGEQNAG